MLGEVRSANASGNATAAGGIKGWGIAGFDATQVAAIAAGSLLTLSICVCLMCRFCRRDAHSHVVLRDIDDSGMPPQIVGAGADDPGAETFVIGGDEDADWEDEDFEYVRDVEAQEAGAWRQHALHESSPRDDSASGSGVGLGGLGSKPAGGHSSEDEESVMSPSRRGHAGGVGGEAAGEGVAGPPVFAGLD